MKNTTLLVSAILTLTLTACVSNPAQEEKTQPRTLMVWSAAPEKAPEPPKEPTIGELTLPELSWLVGCWKSELKGRDYHEHWLPMRNNMLLGTSYTVANGAMSDHQFLRFAIQNGILELVVTYPDKKEVHYAYRHNTKATTSSKESEVSSESFEFVNDENIFPSVINYRRDGDGWMILTVSGLQSGKTKEQVFPIQRADCKTREVEFE